MSSSFPWLHLIGPRLRAEPGNLLRGLGYSLQANHKTREGSSHIHRSATILGIKIDIAGAVADATISAFAFTEGSAFARVRDELHVSQDSRSALGAIQAILDAAALARHLTSSATVEDAFLAYDAERGCRLSGSTLAALARASGVLWRAQYIFGLWKIDRADWPD